MSTYAFVGNGPITQANAFALLNDLFGIKREYPPGHEKEGYPEWPSDERPELYYIFTESLYGGFETAWLYTEYAELPFTAIVDRQIKDDDSIAEAVAFAEEVFCIDDLARRVANDLSLEGAKLIVLTNNGEIDVHVKDVIEACQERGVRVLELTAGLDYYDNKAEIITEAPEVTVPSEVGETNEESGNKSSEDLSWLQQLDHDDLHALAKLLAPYVTVEIAKNGWHAEDTPQGWVVGNNIPMTDKPIGKPRS